jgi:hypothetical protein
MKQISGETRRENAKVRLVHRHCEERCDEAIQNLFVERPWIASLRSH